MAALHTLIQPDSTPPEPTLILALDTSTAVGSIALRNQNGVVGLLTVRVDSTHSEGLMPALDSLLQRTGIRMDAVTALACVTGPGSYTGLRIGVATAQGLAFARQLPCVGLSSLEVLAWALPYAHQPVCPMLPARKGWVYARIYRWDHHGPQPLSDELNLEPDELIQSIHEPTWLYGPGLAPYRESLSNMLQEDFLSPPEVYNLPRADLVAELAWQALKVGKGEPAHRLLPHYLGPSQAEVNWKRRHS